MNDFKRSLFLIPIAISIKDSKNPIPATRINMKVLKILFKVALKIRWSSSPIMGKSSIERKPPELTTMDIFIGKAMS